MLKISGNPGISRCGHGFGPDVLTILLQELSRTLSRAFPSLSHSWEASRILPPAPSSSPSRRRGSGRCFLFTFYPRRRFAPETDPSKPSKTEFFRFAGSLHLPPFAHRNKKSTRFLSKSGAFVWLRGKDLNQRPPGYEPDELPAALPRDIYLACK